MLGGGLILLLAAGLEVFKLDAELKFGNVTSNPNWIRPTPTAFDVALGFLVWLLVVIGAALLLAGVVRYSGK